MRVDPQPSRSPGGYGLEARRDHVGAGQNADVEITRSAAQQRRVHGASAQSRNPAPA